MRDDVHNHIYEIDELVEERRNSIANALELRLSCTNPSKYEYNIIIKDTNKYKCKMFKC